MSALLGGKECEGFVGLEFYRYCHSWGVGGGSDISFNKVSRNEGQNLSLLTLAATLKKGVAIVFPARGQTHRDQLSHHFCQCSKLSRSDALVVRTLRFCEDNDTRAGLEETLDFDFHFLADEGMAAVDHDHGAVGHVSHALVFLLAFAHDFEAENFAGEQDGFEGFGGVVDVDAFDGLKLGDFSEVEIVGVKAGIEVAGKLDEFGVHFLFFGEIAVVDFDLANGAALKAVEHVKAPAAACAADGVVGISDLLELAQDKSRDDDESLHNAGLDEVGDASVNDDAGVEEQDVVGLVLRRESYVRDDEGEVLFVAAHGEDDSDVAEAKEHCELDEPARLMLGVFKNAGVVHEVGNGQSKGEADGGGGE